MKTFLFLTISFSLLICACSCKKTIADSPGYPPGGQYFAVKSQNQELLNNKKLIVKKVDRDGNVLIIKPIVSLVAIPNRNVFRISDSWVETKTIFSEGENIFRFEYGNDLVETIIITASINADNNTISYTEVKCDGVVIIESNSDKPAEQSKIYHL